MDPEKEKINAYLDLKVNFFFLSYLIYCKSEHYVQVPVANVKTTNKLGETRPNLYDKGAIIKVGDSFCAWEKCFALARTLCATVGP
jgi:hypothetical protein